MFQRCLFALLALLLVPNVPGKDIQDYPYIELSSSAFGFEENGSTNAPMLISCHSTSYALLFNTMMLQGYVVDLDKKVLYSIDKHLNFDVHHGSAWAGDIMEAPYGSVTIRNIHLFRNYFSLEEGNRIYCFNTQGVCIKETFVDNEEERIKYCPEDFTPENCLAAFDGSIGPRVLYGDQTYNYDVDLRAGNDGTSVAYMLDRDGKEVWHKELPSAYAVDPEFYLHDFERPRAVNGKIYVHKEGGIACISQNAVEEIIYESLPSDGYIAKLYTCQMGPDECYFIRLVLSEKSSYWEITYVNKDKAHRDKLAIDDPNGILYKRIMILMGYTKESYFQVPPDIAPQMAGKYLVLLTGAGQKWEYALREESQQTTERMTSSELVFFYYSAYLKTYIAITRGRLYALDYKVSVPSRMYFLKDDDQSINAPLHAQTQNSYMKQ